MKKHLPINETPNLACYGYESYNDSIASSNTYLDNTIVEIDNFYVNENIVDDNCLGFESNSIKCYCENGLFRFTSINNALSLNSVLYKKVYGDTNVSLRVSRHLYTTPWAFVSVFVSNSLHELEDSFRSRNYSPYLFGYFKKSGLAKIVGTSYKSLNATLNDGKSYWLRISTLGSHICAYYSDDGQNWIQASCDYVDIGKEYYIGIFLNMGELSYFNWLYSNHLQIYCNADLSENYVPIDYFNPVDPSGISKINPFVDEYRIPCDLIKSLNIDFSSLIHYCIDNNMYVDVPLNERYISNRRAYQKYNYLHYNMIYGYNDDNDTVSILGYDKSLKLKKSDETYKDILKGYFNNVSSDIVLRRYEMNYFPEELNLCLIVNLLTDYLEERDSAERYPGLCLRREKCVFGIAVYDCIVSSDKNLDSFLNDKRIAYFMSEHKRLMVERIQFLTERNIIDDRSCELIKKGKTLYNEAKILMALVLKYNLKPSISLLQNIKNKIATIKLNDIQLSTEILDNLKQYKSKQITAD